MNDLHTRYLQLMTVKEVAAALNVSADLRKKRVRELFPDKMENGKTTYLNEMEVTAVKLRIQENSSLQTYDDCNRLANMPKTQLEKNLLIQQAFNFLKEEEQVLRIELTAVKEQLQLQAPKVEFYNEVLDTKTCYTTQQIASELDLSAQKLNKELNERGVQYKRSGQWMLFEKYKGYNYVDVRTNTFERKDGKRETNHYTVWTEKGREFIHGIMRELT